MQNRQNALHKWLEKTLASALYSINPLAGDASFRRYFRLQLDTITQIVMDAPPDKEALQPFLTVCEMLTSMGIKAPRIHAIDTAQGFVILDDFGDELLLKHLSPTTANKFYKAAMAIILIMQRCPPASTAHLPLFDKQFMLQEISNFQEWFLNRYLKIQLSTEEEQLLNTTFAWLTDEISHQPQVFIHRDYHSRNIMVLNNTEDDIQLGIIDFQDAMFGPFTYDLVSLLKDCYIQWPREQVIKWVTAFYEQSPLVTHCTLNNFIYAFDLCGLQRHLKVLGVFSRLYLRDNKPNYLKDLPLTLHYVMACLESYKELGPFYQFMQKRVRLP